MSNKRILYLFTRTPLHVGAGSSVGAIDQPIVRERHTGFPIIPATGLKGSFSDLWNEMQDGKAARSADGTWLFGSTDSKKAAAGALQFSEARLLAFPIRSAKGSFAWITSPLLLQRAARDGVMDPALLQNFKEPQDDQAHFDSGAQSKVAIQGQIVLEEYTFAASTPAFHNLDKVGNTLAALLPDDPVWQEVKDRLVIVSNGMMSFFAQNACEVAQHVRIDDATGAASRRGLFNQENVPSETLFYSVLHALAERRPEPERGPLRGSDDALKAFAAEVEAAKVFQFGADASTGLGYCTVRVHGNPNA